MFVRSRLLLLCAILLNAPAAMAQEVSHPKNDYSDPANWLCRPNRPDDACGRSNQDSTIVEADGSTRAEKFQRHPDPPIDCFYVYPTVSTDPGGNASMRIAPELVRVVNHQFARFASVCRTFAPVYRQATLTALRARQRGNPIPVDRALAYNDVKDAWDHYLAHDNQGRGVALIGHSQGSLVLAELVQREIDGKPNQRRILSVILAGYRLQVPVGKDVGGDFKSVPLCRSTDQLGCVITFASFRADRPPPPDGQIFAASAGPGLEAACVNPAALAGGSGYLHAYLASGIEEPIIAGDLRPASWTNPPKPITTPFVQVPGLLSAECRNNGTHHYLAIRIHGDPKGARTSTITGDVIVDGRLLADWGLHRVDMHLVMGNLIEIVRRQGQAYRSE
jgi:hypothetical protein